MEDILYVLKFNYDVILGQSYELIPRDSSIVPESFLGARERLINTTTQKLQTR